MRGLTRGYMRAGYMRAGYMRRARALAHGVLLLTQRSLAHLSDAPRRSRLLL